MKLKENEKEMLIASLERKKIMNMPFNYSEDLNALRETCLKYIREYKYLKCKIIESKKHEEELDVLIQKIQKCEPQ